MPAVRFSPEIQLGHMIQALVVVGTIAGWALWGYATIQAQLSREDATIALIIQRMDTDEKVIQQDREVVRAFDQDMRAAVSKISDQIADLKALVAANNATHH